MENKENSSRNGIVLNLIIIYHLSKPIIFKIKKVGFFSFIILQSSMLDAY